MYHQRMAGRADRIRSLLRDLAADFFNEISNRVSLITVTDVALSQDGKHATVFISVYPAEHVEAALDFLKRKRSELREHVKRSTNLKHVPLFDVSLDTGEQKRQRMDELLQSSKDANENYG